MPNYRHAHLSDIPPTILLPYVPGMLHPKTEAWAEIYNVTKVALDPHDDAAYWKLLAMAWREPGALVIVEQDIVPGPGVVEKMIRCYRGAWCTSPYPISGGTVLECGLGCVCFGEGMRRRWPGIMDRVGYIDNDGVEAQSWRRLDTRVALVLGQFGYKPHTPHGTSFHLHDYSK